MSRRNQVTILGGAWTEELYRLSTFTGLRGGQTQFHGQTIIEREVSPLEVANYRRENASVPGP